jgi:hypothetical protein
MMPVYYAPLAPRDIFGKSLIFRYEKNGNCYVITYAAGGTKNGKSVGLIMDSNFVVRDTVYQAEDSHSFSILPDGYLCMGKAFKDNYTGYTIIRLNNDKKTKFYWSPFDSIGGISVQESFQDQCYDYFPKSDFQHGNCVASIQTPIGRYTGIGSRHLNEVTIFREEDRKMYRIRAMKAIVFKETDPDPFRLRNINDGKGNVSWMNDTIGFTAAHDMRFVYYNGKDSSLYFTLWDNASCSQRISKFMLLKLMLNTNQIYVLKTFSVGKFGEGKGGAHLLLDGEYAKSEAELFSANVVFDHGQFDYPGPFTTALPQFGVADSAGHVVFGALYDDQYKAVLYQFQETKQLPVHQPALKCTRTKAGEYNLSIDGRSYEDINWINGSKERTITVTQPADYIAWMKDNNMFGYVFSKPMTVSDSTCPILGKRKK